VNKIGLTALHLAGVRGDEECVRLLLQCGADVNACDKAGMTALHCAVGHAGCIRLLLQVPCMVNVGDTKGMTPLYHASALGCVECVDLLLRAGAFVNAANGCGFTPLQVALMQMGEQDLGSRLKFVGCMRMLLQVPGSDSACCWRGGKNMQQLS